jgi:fructose-1,6-bisphosphatase I
MTNSMIPTLILVGMLLGSLGSFPQSTSFQISPYNYHYNIRPHQSQSPPLHHDDTNNIRFTNIRKMLLHPLLLSSSSSSFTRLYLDNLPNNSDTTTTTTTTSPLLLGINNNNNPKKKNLKTYQRYLEIECWKRAEFRELEPVLQSVAESCKQINRIVQRAQTDDLYGVAYYDTSPTTTATTTTSTTTNIAATNIQGEVQQQLDILCNTYMLRAFCGSGSSIHSVASEEEEEPRCCSDVMADTAFAVGDYIAVFDPMDGSKNIDASLPVGSIFGIYKCQPGKQVDHTTFLQDGRSLVAAGYCLFSATTVLVLTMGSGVDGFTLDPDSGRFLHTHKDIRIPRRGPIYSFNEANYRDFGVPERRYLSMLKEGNSATGIKKMNARYIGALVADVHNILINGGIYGYPATRKTHPHGKLRLLYECAPMAMIIEQAGGAASTGSGRVLDVKPTDIHQRTPVFLGSVENVFELDQFFQYYDNNDDDDDRDDHEDKEEKEEEEEVQK